MQPNGEYSGQREELYGRGTFCSGDDGSFAFETWYPVNYGGMGQHIHFKVNADGHDEVVSQMLFSTDKLLHVKKFQVVDDTTTTTPEEEAEGSFDVTYNITVA